MKMGARFLILLLSMTYPLINAQEAKEVAKIEFLAGVEVVQTGKYKLNFTISKDWKLLCLDITDKDGNAILTDFKRIEVMVRPFENKSPFKVVLEGKAVGQEGVNVASHFEAELKFTEVFKGLRVNTVLTVLEERCVSECAFKRD